MNKLKHVIISALILSIGITLIAIGIYLYSIKIEITEWYDHIKVTTYKMPYGVIAIALGFIGIMWCAIAVSYFIYRCILE